MIKFVVVEDEPLVQEIIKKILRQISVKNEENLEIVYYKKYTPELQNEIDNELYRKVYIMDIELENSISGIEIAEKIRENDWDSVIIFVTSHDSMFETVHRAMLQVFDFIEKWKNMETRLADDIQKIFNKKIDSRMLKLHGKHVDLDIYMKNILYITRDKEDRKAVIHTDTDNVSFKVSYSLTELKEMLDNRFVQTHKGCLANKKRMTEKNYAKGYFVLDNGKSVDMLSKKYRKEIDAE